MPRWPSPDELPATRVCKKCDQEKPVDEFLYLNGFTCKLCSKEYKAAHYQENKEHYRALNEEWNEENLTPEKRRAYAKTWREAHPELFTERIKEWQQNNPEKLSEYNRRRSSLIRGASSLEPYTRQELWERDGGICYWCGLLAEYSFESRSNKVSFTVDHVVPLVRGGPDDLSNVVVAHLSCNQSHNRRLISELPEGWAEERRKKMEPLVRLIKGE